MSNKTVLITGGSNGIGLAITAQLLNAGYNVAVLSRKEGKLKELKASLYNQHSILEHYPCDITKMDEVENVVQNLKDKNTGINILINNAGIALGAPKRFWEQDFSDIEAVTSTNISGLLNVTYSVLRHFLIPASQGTIVNISSVTGLETPVKGMGEVTYHSSKAYMEGFSNTLRNELIGTNIRLLVVRPGFVETDFHFNRVGKDESKFEAVFDGIEPLVPDNVAESVWWMLSQPENISIKALDVVPTAQRSLTQVDREWKERHKAEA